MDFFIWLENSALGEWVRISLWAFPFLLTVHAIGLAFVAGIAGAISLRLLGVAPGVPLAPLAGFMPAAWGAFVLNLASGLALFAGDAQMFITSGAFQIKLALIVLGLVNLVLIGRLVLPAAAGIEGGKAPGRVRVMAAASLVCWAGAIVAGRLIAYTASPF